jgi:hypothetical protein
VFGYCSRVGAQIHSTGSEAHERTKRWTKIGDNVNRLDPSVYQHPNFALMY